MSIATPEEVAPPLTQDQLIGALSSFNHEQLPPTEEVAPLSTRFNSFVIERRDIGTPEVLDAGTIRWEYVKYSDHARRIALIAEPNAKYHGKDRVSRVPLVGTMPWTISAKGGIFIEDFVKPALEEGYPVVLLSHEGEGEAIKTPTTPVQWYRFFSRLTGIELARSAHHIHAFLNDLGSNVDFDTASIISVLDSEGAMTTFGTVVQAELHNRKVPYFDIIDPILRKILSRGGLNRMRGTARAEGAAVVDLVGRMVSGDVRHGKVGHLRACARTVNFHPLSLLGELAYMPTLARGQSGRMAAKMHPDTRGTVTYMKGSFLSKADQESAALDGFTNIRVLPAEGAHTQLAQWRNQRNRLDRLAALKQEMLQTDYNFDAVDWRRLYVGAVAITEA